LEVYKKLWEVLKIGVEVSEILRWRKRKKGIRCELKGKSEILRRFKWSNMPSTPPVDIVSETDEMKGCILHFTLWPRQWQTYTQSHEWQNEKLETASATRIPESPGIYTLIIQPGIAGHPSCSYLMYVGKTVSLRRRFREYLGMERRPDGRPKISYFLNKYDQFIFFFYTLVSTEAVDNVEEGLKNAYLPPLNEEYEGTIGTSVRAFS
jgi:hypothetical protein